MNAARQGIITPEMKAVAAKEYRTEEEIRDLVTKGQVVVTDIAPGYDHITSDIAKKIPHARDLDDAMADARRIFDWKSSGRALLTQRPQNRFVIVGRRSMKTAVPCAVSSVLSEV